MGAYIITEDRVLGRLLALLLEEARFPLVSREEATLLLVDLDSCEERTFSVPALGFTRLGKDASFPVLPRPFDEELFLTALEELRRGDAPPTLTPTERRLLAVLIEAEGEPVSRQALLVAAFGKEEADNQGLLNVYIHYLREKLERDGKKRIFAHRGKGYSYRC